MKAIILSIFSLILTIFVCNGQSKNKKAATANAQKVTIIPHEKDKRVDVLINGQLFTSYIYPEVLKKPVLYPVKTSRGTFITRGWPLNPRSGERTDHPHHVGIWFNYGDVNGYDFWNNSNEIARDHKGPFGTIRHQQIDKMVSGKDKGELEVTSLWLKDDGSVLLKEQTHFTFSGTGNIRVITRTCTLTAQKEPVLFKDNKEGLFALRVARELEHPSDKPEVFTDANGNATRVPVLNNEGVTGKYLSSEGKEGDAVWGTRGKWVVLNGKIGDEPVSVLILDHPRNPGFPSYWHARGYGLFAINSLGQAAMSDGKDSMNLKLEPGKSVTFSYRMVIFSGKQPGVKEISEAFNRFAAE